MKLKPKARIISIITPLRHLSLGIQLFLISSELFFNMGYIPLDWAQKNFVTLEHLIISMLRVFSMNYKDESFLYKLVTSVSLKILTFVLLLKCSSINSCHLFGSFICFGNMPVSLNQRSHLYSFFLVYRI